MHLYNIQILTVSELYSLVLLLSACYRSFFCLATHLPLPQPLSLLRFLDTSFL